MKGMNGNAKRTVRVGRMAALCGLLAFAAAPVGATEIYRWVDADGVVHFSQTAPAGAVGGVRRETVENPVPSGYDPEQDIYDVAGQQERMQALRAEQERRRSERREREAQAAPPPASAPQGQGYPVYWGPGYRPRPPLRPRPPIDRPIEPPVEPSRPTGTLRPPGSGQN
jgi:hypothetical protein